jgi:uncharacterized sulfatase
MRAFLTGIALVSLVLLPGCPSREATPAGVRHAVVIVVDTLRADALGVYGNSLGSSPNLDALARESVVFDRAWAQSTFTPGSYMSYMTSTYVRTHGWDYHPADYPDAGVCGWTDLELLPEVLARHGFDRVALVANHALHPKRGFSRGFERWNGLEVARLGSSDSDYRLDDDAVVERARQEIAAWRDEGRHFLYVHLLSPHLPLSPSTEARARFGLSAEGGIDLDKIVQWRKQSTPQERQLSRQVYLACVWDADRRVRRILDALDDPRRREDTVVAFFADHGEELWEHGDYGHQDGVWEALTHVPLIVRAPKLPPRRVSDPVGLLDVPPTLLALLGINEKPRSWQGQDLFAGRARPGVVSQRFAEVGVTLDGRTKIVGSPEAGGDWAMFDLKSDPAEQKPRRANPSIDSLRRLYEAWKARTPKVERDRNATPVGVCGTLSSEERQEQIERLRSLGYVH